MSKDVLFIIGFVALLVLAGFSTASRERANPTATSTPPEAVTEVPSTDSSSVISRPPTGGSSATQNPTPDRTERTPAEIEREVERLYRELEKLEAAVRVARLSEPRSPYADLITLERGDARNFARDSEYITLKSSSQNRLGVTITGWRLESYVTGARAVIPDGVAGDGGPGSTLRRPITLEANERAYLHTRRAPEGFSFKETICTGYLGVDTTIAPRLSLECPLAADELGRFEPSLSRDRDCAAFARSLRRCDIPSRDDMTRADLDRDCRDFLTDFLDYETCVRVHATDPVFALPNADWRIFLGASSELWRSEREIIRLLDEAGRVVDYIEY
jgi:hypothetical protein